MNNHYKNFTWLSKLDILINICNGLKNIHQKQIIHRDLHTGNILFLIELLDEYYNGNICYISDMGLCKEVSNIDNAVDETKIYGVMLYVAPEVLRGKPHTQAADIYSFGMIMYFAATGRQPFANCAHDEFLALDICKGTRPEINKLEVPKCYVNLMKKCWYPNPENRPTSIEIYESLLQFNSINNPPYEIVPIMMDENTNSDENIRIKGDEITRTSEDEFIIAGEDEIARAGEDGIKRTSEDEIRKQFREAKEYRIANFSTNENNQSVTHPQAIYTS